MKSVAVWVLIATAGLLTSSAGCKPETAPTPATGGVSDSARPNDEHGTDDHSVTGHTHGAGPNGGTIVDWGGGKFHVEFVVDHDKQEATVYILGPDEKAPLPIKADGIELFISDPAVQMVLKPAPLESDADGLASRFTGSHDALRVVKEFSGTISGVVEGTPYSGDFEEQPHVAPAP